MKTLVLGVGNPIMCDDGVGIRVARALGEKLNDPETAIMETSAAGLDFLELLGGYDKAVIIDAIQTRGGKPGQVYRLSIDSFDSTHHASNPHDVNFATALELGRILNLPLPEIAIFAIEVEDVTSFSEQCTPAVERAIPVCARMVLRELEQDNADAGRVTEHGK